MKLQSRATIISSCCYSTCNRTLLTFWNEFFDVFGLKRRVVASFEDPVKSRKGDTQFIDLFTASFPCNDLSIAGAQAGLGGKESSACWGLIHILKELAGYITTRA